MNKKEDKLPKEFKKKWLKALRGGLFKQGTSSLRDPNNNYCCLGVAAKIAGCERITNKGFIMNYNSKRIRGITKVPKLLLGDRGIPEHLANMNDSGKSFKHIADYIEKNL